MDLHFTRPDILNTVLRDARGTPLYRVETNSSIFSEGTTTISRIVGAPESGPNFSEYVVSDDRSDTDILLHGLEEKPVGQILWRRVKPSIFKLGETEVPVDRYMPPSRRHIK